QSQPEPDDDQRRQRHLRHGLEHDDERIEEVFGPARQRDRDAERKGEHRAKREAEQGLGERDPDVVDIEPRGDTAIERHEDAAGRRQNEERNAEQPDDAFPGRQEGGDQDQPQQEARARGLHSMPPPPLSTARIRRVCTPNASVVMTSRLRGRGSRTSNMSPMRPGRAVITRTRSARNTASVVEWVTNSTVLRRSSQMRCSSTFMVSRVSASSAPNGSSISSSAGSWTSART